MGYISQNHTGIWCYKSIGFKTAFSLINSFDRYNLFTGKYISYLKFRKVCIMIAEVKRLEDKRVKKKLVVLLKDPQRQVRKKFNIGLVLVLIQVKDKCI